MPDNTNNSNFVDEDNIPSNLVPIDTPAIVPGRVSSGAPAPPVPHDMPQYFSGSLSPALQHDSHFVATEMASPRIPKTALMPFGNQANPTTNAAVQSTAKITAQQVIAATPPSSAAISVGLTMPSIFTAPVSGSPVTGVGTLGVTLASEAADTVFAGPSSNVPGFDNATQGAATGTVSAGNPVILSLSSTSSVSNPWAFVVADAGGGNTVNNPAGWTSLGGSRGFVGYNSLTNANVNFTETITAFNTFTYNMVGCMALFGSTPTIVQTKAPTNGTSLAFSSNTHAGNVILVAVNGIGNPNAISVSDTQGNQYQQLAFAINGGAGGQINFAAIFVTFGISAAACTVTATYIGTTSSQQMSLMEVNPFPVIAAIPTFRKLQPQDIPELLVSKIASIDFNNLAGVGLPAKFNNVTLVANGLPSEIQKVDLTAQAAAIAASPLINPTSQTGIYRISWCAIVTQAATTSSTLGGANAGFQINYTDNDTGAAATTPLAAAPAAGTNTAYSQTNSQNTVGTQISGEVVVNAKTGTAITFNFGYTSVGATVMQYALHIRLEAM